jgi:uncharacterized protein YqeY
MQINYLNTSQTLEKKSLPTLHLENVNPIIDAETKVQRALDELVSTGVLQPCNRMDLEALLNPLDERRMMEEVTDEEICQTVLKATKAREESVLKGGDDGDDDDTPIEAPPSRREVLQAASVISKYLDHQDEPVARKLEAVLASFKRQICLQQSSSMGETAITDYFTRI